MILAAAGITNLSKKELLHPKNLRSQFKSIKLKSGMHSEFTCESETNQRLPSFFSFDTEEDLKEGKFDFVVLHEGRELLRKQLTIQVPNRVAEGTKSLGSHTTCRAGPQPD